MDHWWFLKWENQGDAALRYFLEPAVLTVNYAKAHGYDWIGMAGLSGGGWSTTFASAIDKRINASFPIAGSTPCGLRNPVGQVPGQIWTGGVNTTLPTLPRWTVFTPCPAVLQDADAGHARGRLRLLRVRAQPRQILATDSYKRLLMV